MPLPARLTVTVLLASAVPLKTSVVSLVFSSELELPVSEETLTMTGAAGAVLSTVKVALGPAAAAVLPARSEAVPAAIEMPSVPLPVMLETVTVRVVLLPVTATDPDAVPVVFSVTSVPASVLPLK